MNLNPPQEIKVHKNRIKQPDNPYSLLLFSILYQAIKDSRCYLNKKGTYREQVEGRIAIKWVKQKGGIFPLIALAAEDSRYQLSPDMFYIWVNKKISILEQESKTVSK